jgi:hypothetical protein
MAPYSTHLNYKKTCPVFLMKNEILLIKIIFEEIKDNGAKKYKTLNNVFNLHQDTHLIRCFVKVSSVVKDRNFEQFG